jgi:hypothetical protein
MADGTKEQIEPTDSLKAGQSVGQQFVPMLKFFLDNADNRVHFWAGFIGVIAGTAGADIGSEATDVLGRAFTGIVDEIAKSKAH